MIPGKIRLLMACSILFSCAVLYFVLSSYQQALNLVALYSK